MRNSHLAILFALSTLTTAQSDDFSIEDTWQTIPDFGRNNWTTAFPNKSPKSSKEVNATSDGTFSNPQLFAQLYEGLHNEYRSEHNVPALTWNMTLASAAQSHAENCKMEHSENNPYGENLVAGYANMSDSIAAWGEERKEYDFGKGEFGDETGHFTQMVWGNTTQIGCGRCYCGGGKEDEGGDGSDKAPGWLVVCEYSPPGNVEGQFKDNVLQGGYVKGAASGVVVRSGLVLVMAAVVGALMV